MEVDGTHFEESSKVTDRLTKSDKPMLKLLWLGSALLLTGWWLRYQKGSAKASKEWVEENFLFIGA
ncbi:MAG: hypothetical protein Q9M35_00845 [Rhodothermus sp.]|nr:hypothetical protein [Rhodothermus sp.]